MIITAEHFTMTDSLKRVIEESFDKIERLLSGDSPLRVFLKRDTREEFQLTLAVHDGHSDVAYTTSGRDLGVLIRSAKNHLLRNLMANRKAVIRSRRRASA